MNCNEFQHWLLSKDVFGEETPEALFHLKTCEPCKKLYMTDTSLEKNIQSVFSQQEVPKNLINRIDKVIEQERPPLRLNISGITAMAAGIVMIITLALFVHPDKPFRYQSIDHLTQKAVINHLKGNTAMSFSADKMDEAVVMLRKALGFNVIIPDLSKRGYALVGGRICFLGECRTAYLFYKKNDKTCSLFILDEGYLDFKLADGVQYSTYIKECRSDVWKENGQIYALVSSL